MSDILTVLHRTNKLYLSGLFGSGKTTLALDRIRWLLQQERVRGDDILVIVPQRTLAQPYYDALRRGDMPAGAPVRVTTFAGLARASVELYWPLLAPVAEFSDPHREPTFLNLETSQYHMAAFVDETLAHGDFDGIRIERSRVISQVLDNLTKAALHGFTIDETYERLELAVPSGEQRTGRINALRAALDISQRFRKLCLDKTLIDFSLQIELFNKQVLTNSWSSTHLFRAHKHLIFENGEENNSSAHNLIQQWIPHLDSALILVDTDAGYRLFLGADPLGVKELAQACDEQITLTESHIMPPTLHALTDQIDLAVRGPQSTEETKLSRKSSISHDPTIALDDLIIPEVEFRFYPQMLGWVVEEIQKLVNEEGVPPGQIAVLAPFVSDALRFSLQTALREVGIDSTTHRPSRALQDEPAARTLLTLTKLAHPHWQMRPEPADVTLALSLSIDALDPVRANLLSRIAYPPRRSTIELGRFGELVPEMQQRITYTIGEAYDHLRDWLYAYRSSPELVPMDQFLARLFGEVLSQPGYGFHQDLDAARVSNQLVDSARNFRWALENVRPDVDKDVFTLDLGREYLALVESGALGALYVPGWREAEGAVFLSPAYTFMMRNRAVDVQFWLDIGSGGWWERLAQPLTHPYVLSKRWPGDRPWDDLNEFTTRQDAMRRLLIGLIRRTRQRVYLGMSNYSESGFEQSGPLKTL